MGGNPTSEGYRQISKLVLSFRLAHNLRPAVRLASECRLNFLGHAVGHSGLCPHSWHSVSEG